MSGQSAAGVAASVGSEDSTHQLLSGFQFFFLCLVVMASYYISLHISVHAVGESTAPLSAPIAAASSLFYDVGNTILRKINRRRNRTQVGAVSYEDEADDANDIFSVNQPGAGVQ
ncbi:hypothetical protein LPMP_323740 [Leishmania panamensis]|uniref:Uncharacterized protein n=6 Tax=Viannia TaxID=37616 RepID=E9AIV3_LEIBR|nr:conserved hypothetical protein [Leishmania braziliensis MHOM/BR/75/M2904]XP_010702056.1 hypothetical protein LPMP_323740 [Leishmania panamensis]KAI5687757.1 hypothetical protein MNV84_06822 [Leishmania braziliensis]CCM18422.1 hypothetical protein, conserved [Leishmania guyanensis]AIO01256.1 hypothetical protein LPMP_323740 [Leishmania panamensis]CAJ2478954.1 unnamed protein product [Leishmania braziliensis]CAJ2479356.1 unnamed protein product [Leishmania braziliensis]